MSLPRGDGVVVVGGRRLPFLLGKREDVQLDEQTQTGHVAALRVENFLCDALSTATTCTTSGGGLLHVLITR